MLFVILLACSQPAPPPPVVVAPEAAAPEPEVAEPQARPEATKLNKPPLIRSATITPRNATVRDDVVVDVQVTDPEGMGIDETYTWRANGEELAGYKDSRLPAGLVKRGDVLSAHLVASDGEKTSEAELGSITIANASPVMDTAPSDVRSLNYLQLNAHDPDGDKLSWKVEGAPEGLTVDASGIVRYAPSLTAKAGKYTVKVTADDGNGGWASLSFPVAVSAGSDAPKDAVPTGAAAPGGSGGKAP